MHAECILSKHKTAEKSEFERKPAMNDIANHLADKEQIHNEVIHIFGASGSGTTTLGNYLSEKMGYYHMDTDDYFWENTNPPYTVKRERSARIAMMKKDIEQYGNVVISGSLSDWGDVLIPSFTLAIRLETDTSVRIERLKEREKRNFGSRIDVGGDMYETNKKFLEWAASYDMGGLDIRSQASHDEWQKLLQCGLIVLNGNAPLEENYEIIKHSLNMRNR